MIISFHYQHKERKGDRVQPPTQRERGREYGRQATTHTQSRSSPQLNEGAEPSRVAQTPQPKAQKAMHHQNKKRFIMYQGEIIIISFDY